MWIVILKLRNSFASLPYLLQANAFKALVGHLWYLPVTPGKQGFV